MLISKFVSEMPEEDKNVCIKEYVKLQETGFFENDSVLREYCQQYVDDYMGGKSENIHMITVIIMLEIYKEKYEASCES